MIREELRLDPIEAFAPPGGFAPEAAGAVMTGAFIAIAPHVTAAHAIEGLRQIAQEADARSYVYVTDSDGELRGVLSFHDLVFADPRTPVASLMIRNVTSVPVDTPMDEVAHLLRDSGLLALPVLDARHRLLGIITIDDVIDVLENEHTEDLAHFAGTDAEAMAQRSAVQVARLRLPWLLGTMAIELMAGLVIHRFDGVLQQVILLASFMPVISAISGNVGLQSAAIVVRGLDTGFVRVDRWWKSLQRELAAALMMAIGCGSVLGVIGAVWSGKVEFGIVIGGAMICSMLTAGFMGTMVPMVSKKLGFDPAATAGPFETAFQDVVGFAVFLWLGSLMVGYLT
jgi:magnesium transporter